MKNLRIRYLILILFLISLVRTDTIIEISKDYDEQETLDGFSKIYLIKVATGTRYIKIKTIPVSHEIPVNFFLGDVSFISYYY